MIITNLYVFGVQSLLHKFADAKKNTGLHEIVTNQNIPQN